MRRVALFWVGVLALAACCDAPAPVPIPAPEPTSDAGHAADFACTTLDGCSQRLGVPIPGSDALRACYCACVSDLDCVYAPGLRCGPEPTGSALFTLVCLQVTP